MRAGAFNRYWRRFTASTLVATAFVACKPVAPPAVPALQPPEVKLDLIDPYLAAGITAGRSNVLAAPRSAAAWGHLGQALHAAEFHGDARRCYQRAAELETNSIRWFHLLGLVQLQHEPEAALSNLTRAVEMAGSSADASRVQLTHAMVERGWHDEAMKHIQVLLAVDPLHAAARLEQARVQLARNQPEFADASLGPCLTNLFTARPAMLLLSQVRQRQGRGDEAAAISRRALAIPRNFDWPDPFLRDVQAMRADRQRLQDRINAFLVQRQLPEAAAALEVMFKAFPEDPESWLLLGRLRLLERKCDEAEAAYRRHLAVRTNSLNGLIQLALTQLCQEQWTNAIGTLQLAIGFKPDFAQAHYNLGYAWSRAGQPELAIRGYREALRCNPGDANTHAALAEELLRAGKRGEAVLELNKVLELNPENLKARQAMERLQSSPP